jgi:hypothetical protein
MDEAFDAAFEALDDMGQPKIVREVIAQRIIEAAKGGERDPGRLVEGRSPLAYPRKVLSCEFGSAAR